MPATLESIGVKPNESYFHNTMRMVVAFLFLLIMIVLVYFASRAKPTHLACIEDVEDIIRPGTQFHNALLDMDPIDRSKYIAVLNGSLRDTGCSKIKKIYRGVIVSLISGMLAEYVMHGNVTKSVGVIGKTGLNSTLSTLIT
jgi:hypothetical protein